LNDRVEGALTQLGAAFAVRDIMISHEDLQLVDDKVEVGRFFEKYENYDYTASPRTGRITTYYRRGDPQEYPLRQEDLLSDGTGLLDLLDLLARRDFYFVLSANRLCGFVHFSDLNNEMVKLALFMLLAAVERPLWRKVSEGFTEEELRSVLVPERFDEVLRRLEEAREERADRDIGGLLFLARFSSSPRSVACSTRSRAMIAAVSTIPETGLRIMIVCL
jgi:hypothetical protein